MNESSIGFIPQCILIDAVSWPILKDALLEEIRNATELVGFDIETTDERRHEGLNQFMKVNAEGHKASNKKLVFDTNRTDVTGFSVYVEHSPYAYYVNLMHADVENRLPWSEARQIIEAIPGHTSKIAHNATYECTMMQKSLGMDVKKNLICSMQLAVSLFNGDTYSVDEFMQPGLRGIDKLMPKVMREFATYDPNITKELTKEQAEVFYQVVAKESKAAHSYVGFVKEIAYGYSLKKLTKRFLGYEQTSFETVLNGKAHMGQLTGAEVCAYGADDAWTCLRLYRFLINAMLKENPAVIQTFFEQENPMIPIYSKVWGQGARLNLQAVYASRDRERRQVCATLRIMKDAVNKLLPFPAEKHDKLERYDPKYKSDSYRAKLVAWAKKPNVDDDFEQLYQVKSALSTQWASETGKKESAGMSINYYQVIRCILYDLCQCSFQLSQGKILGDADARDVMRERWIKKHLDNGTIKKDPNRKPYLGTELIRLDPASQGYVGEGEAYEHFKTVYTILMSYKQLADSETAIKLFINNYVNLTDPDTGRVYPTLNSLLASRRMALSTPNLSQLPKFGGSAYIRGYFLPDEPWVQNTEGLWVMGPPSFEQFPKCEKGYEQVILSADWSGIELVLIGDASGDPTFAEAYSSVPHGDVHTGTAADLLGMTLQEFKAQPNAKQVRNEVGKPANFGYWYSGALGTTANEQNWSSEFHWEAVDRYRNRYPVAEQWRLQTISDAREYGYVVLPDKHTRIRFESTYTWALAMRDKFAMYGSDAITRFGELVIKKIQSRSGNQAVNSKIQGTCATLAKRTAITMDSIIEAKKYNARFMFPVHDEFVFSTQVNQLWKFMQDLYTTMCTHPDIMKTLKLDASMAIGLNYQAYHAETNPKGQIELSELTKLPFIPEDRWGKKATEEEVMLVCDYLYDRLEVRDVSESVA